MPMMVTPVAMLVAMRVTDRDHNLRIRLRNQRHEEHQREEDKHKLFHSYVGCLAEEQRCRSAALFFLRHTIVFRQSPRRQPRQAGTHTLRRYNQLRRWPTKF